MTLEVTNVRKSYAPRAERVDVLTGLNLKVEDGSTTAIVGPSGSGKSTLLSILAGLDRPDSGSVKAGGQELTTMTGQQLARFRAESLGIVFQQFHLMTQLTALENVLLPLEITRKSDGQAKARAALESVGLGARLDHYPFELSGGECQRVAIARALVVKPKLLLADEPSGNLDSATGAHVMDLLFRLVSDGGSTMILVTHNDELAKRCDRRLTLLNGQLTDG